MPLRPQEYTRLTRDDIQLRYRTENDMVAHAPPRVIFFLPKTEYTAYGTHRFGWKNVVATMIEEFGHIETQLSLVNFEWIQYSIRNQLPGTSCYETAVAHARETAKSTIPQAIQPRHPSNIILDDWFEKTLNWGKDTPVYTSPFVTFMHDPILSPDLVQLKMSRSMEAKKRKMRQVLDGMWLNPVARQHLSLIFVFSRHQQQQLKTYMDGLPVPMSVPSVCLYHPIPAKRTAAMFSSRFDCDAFITMPAAKRCVYHIGWWLRRVDSFLKVSFPGTKVMLMKTDDIYAMDYVQFEVRQTLVGRDHVQNTSYQAPLTNDERATLWRRHRTVVRSSVDNAAYDAILKNSIVFLDLYECAANNVVLECILYCTPLLVRPLPSVVEYLGKEYPFYFDTDQEASERLNDNQLIRDTHSYLVRLNASAFQAMSMEKFAADVALATASVIIFPG